MNPIIAKTFVAALVAATAIATFASTTVQAAPFPHSRSGLGDASLTRGTLAVTPASSYDCGTIRQTMVDRYGNIVGYRYVPAC